MKILGHTFKKMKPSDYEGLAGASPNALVCYADDVTLLYEPDNEFLFEIGEDEDGVPFQNAWKITQRL